MSFVTRTLSDTQTGEPLVVVYVPTAPNPISGYLETVPLARVTPADWTFNEAINFIVSGGAVAPEQLPYHSRTPSAKQEG